MDAPPGVGALGVLEALEALPFDDLSVSDAGVALRTAAGAYGRLDVVQALLLGIFTRGNGARADGATDAAAWLAAKTKTSGRDASRAVKRAKVIEALPALGDALSAGEISAAHVDAVAGIVPAALLAKAGSLVAAAKSSTPEELERKAQRLVIDNDGDGGAARAERLRARRQVRFFNMDSGMRALFGEWEPTATDSIERAVDLVADQLWRALHPDRKPTVLDEKTLKFRRADAVSEIARRVLAGTETGEPETAGTEATEPAGAAVESDDGPTAAEPDPDTADEAADDVADGADGPAVNDAVAAVKPPITSKRVTAPKARPAVVSLSVLIDFQTLLGHPALKGICELFDGTPISPDTVRRLACDAAIIPMVLGSRGEVLNQGRRIYAPTMAQRHAVAIRDRHCAFPGCRRPAKWTDVHHIVAFKPGSRNGGRTDLDNLLLLCDVHHHLVHEGHWRLNGTAFDFDVFRPDGSLFDHVTRGPP